MPFLAFHHQKITEFFDLRSQYLVDYLKDYSELEIAKMSEVDIKFLLDKCKIEVPVINTKDVEIEKASAYTDAQKTIQQTSFNQNYEMGDSRAINNFLFFKVSYIGDETVFYLRPYSDFPGIIGIDSLATSKLVFRFILDPYQSMESQIQNHVPTVKNLLQNIQAVLEKIKPDIENFNLNLRNYLINEIQRRKYVSTKREAIRPELPQIQSKPEVKSLGSLDLS